MLASETMEHVLKNGISLMRYRKKEYVKGQPIQYDVKEAFTGNKKGWVYIDAFTASAVSQIFKAINEKNQFKFNCLPIQTIIDFTWKHVK